MSKWGNIKTTFDGIKFDSRKEKNRYFELKMLLSAGLIKDLVLQPRFTLLDKFKYRGKSIRSIVYVPDFQYYDNERNITVVEDVKSSPSSLTSDYKIKAKMFKNMLKDRIDIVFVEIY